MHPLLLALMLIVVRPLVSHLEFVEVEVVSKNF
jgi:hypothetical protein